MVIYMQIFTVLFRTIFFYFFVLISYRIMGKREIGQLGVIDLIVSILIAELVAISIEEFKQPLSYTIIPITCLVILEVLFAFISIKSRKFRTIFDGKPSLIIVNGKINYKEMIKQRYTLDDLLMELRSKDIKNLADVEYAVLENNGKLSVFKYNFLKIKSENPFPLILDGKIQTSTLKYINKDKTWLLNLIGNKDVSEVFYCFYKNNKAYIIDKKDVE